MPVGGWGSSLFDSGDVYGPGAGVLPQQINTFQIKDRSVAQKKLQFPSAQAVANDEVFSLLEDYDVTTLAGWFRGFKDVSGVRDWAVFRLDGSGVVVEVQSSGWAADGDTPGASDLVLSIVGTELLLTAGSAAACSAGFSFVDVIQF